MNNNDDDNDNNDNNNFNNTNWQPPVPPIVAAAAISAPAVLAASMVAPAAAVAMTTTALAASAAVVITREPPAKFFNDPRSSSFTVALRIHAPAVAQVLTVDSVLEYADGERVARQEILQCRARQFSPSAGTDGAGVDSLKRTRADIEGASDTGGAGSCPDASRAGPLSQRCELSLVEWRRRQQRQPAAAAGSISLDFSLRLYLAQVSSRLEHGNRAFCITFTVGTGADAAAAAATATRVRTSAVQVLAKDPLKRKRGPKYFAHKAYRAAIRAAKRAAKDADTAARKAVRATKTAEAGARRVAREQARPHKRARPTLSPILGTGAASRNAHAGLGALLELPLGFTPRGIDWECVKFASPRGMDWHFDKTSSEHDAQVEPDTDSEQEPENESDNEHHAIPTPHSGSAMPRAIESPQRRHVAITTTMPCLRSTEADLTFALECLLSEAELADLDVEMSAADDMREGDAQAAGQADAEAANSARNANGDVCSDVIDAMGIDFDQLDAALEMLGATRD